MFVTANVEKKKEITYKEGKMSTSVPTWGIQSYGAGLEGGGGRGANVQLSGGTAISYNGGALRDSRSVGGYPLMCGGMCVRQDCGRMCSGASYGPW